MKKQTKILIGILAALALCLAGSLIYAKTQKQQVYRYVIRSEQGFTFEDVDRIRALEPVEAAYAIMAMENKDGDSVILCELNGNQTALLSGRFPEGNREVLVSSRLENSYAPGDTILLGGAQYKVTGIFDGQNEKDISVYGLPSCFSENLFPSVGIEICGSEPVGEILGEELTDIVNARLNELLEENEGKISQLQTKYDLIEDAGDDEINSAKEKLDEAKGLLEDASNQIQNYEGQIADGEAELASLERQLNDAQGTIKNGKQQLDSVLAEINASRDELNARLAEQGFTMEDVIASNQAISDYAAAQGLTDEQLDEMSARAPMQRAELAAYRQRVENATAAMNQADESLENARKKLNTDLSHFSDDLTGILRALRTLDLASLISHGITLSQISELRTDYESLSAEITEFGNQSTALVTVLEEARTFTDFFPQEEQETIDTAAYAEALQNLLLHPELETGKEIADLLRGKSAQVITGIGTADGVLQLLENRETIAALIAGNDAINEAQRAYDQKYSEYLSGVNTYGQEKARFDSAVSDLTTSKEEIAASKGQLQEKQDEYNRQKEEFDEAYADYGDALNAVDQDKKVYEEKRYHAANDWQSSNGLRLSDKENTLFSRAIPLILIGLLLLTVLLLLISIISSRSHGEKHA